MSTIRSAKDLIEYVTVDEQRELIAQCDENRPNARRNDSTPRQVRSRYD